MHLLKSSFLCPVLQILGILSSLLVSVRTELASVFRAQLPWTKSAVKYSAEASEWELVYHTAPKLTAHHHLCLCIMLFDIFIHRAQDNKSAVNMTNSGLWVWFAKVLHSAELINLFLYVRWPGNGGVHLLQHTCPRKHSRSQQAPHWASPEYSDPGHD